MQIFHYPQPSEWSQIVSRPQLDVVSLHDKVSSILCEVRKHGDEALRRFSMEFDGVAPLDFRVTPQEYEEADALVPVELKAAIIAAKENIARFHASQQLTVRKIETQPGVRAHTRPSN